MWGPKQKHFENKATQIWPIEETSQLLFPFFPVTKAYFSLEG